MNYLILGFGDYIVDKIYQIIEESAKKQSKMQFRKIQKKYYLFLSKKSKSWINFINNSKIVLMNNS